MMCSTVLLSIRKGFGADFFINSGTFNFFDLSAVFDRSFGSSWCQPVKGKLNIGSFGEFLKLLKEKKILFQHPPDKNQLDKIRVLLTMALPDSSAG